MTSLTRVTNRAYHQDLAQDTFDVWHDIKIRNDFLNSRWHQDFAAVADVDTSIEHGTILTIQSGDILTVSEMRPDTYGAFLIRYDLELVLNNNTIIVDTPVPITTAQGGHRGFTWTSRSAAIPCKTGLITTRIMRDTNIDQDMETMGCLLSVLYPVNLGDHVVFGHTYVSGKVKSVTIATQGLQEIHFNFETRGN
jgi:hypothetical protein